MLRNLQNLPGPGSTGLPRRLAKEEEELLPLAQRVISSEEWFAIAAQFLSLDAENKARQQSVCHLQQHLLFKHRHRRSKAQLWSPIKYETYCACPST